MDILLNMKIEQAQKEDAAYSKQHRGGDMYINSSRGGHGASCNDMNGESQRSSNSSVT
jgi:hypothetical protein